MYIEKLWIKEVLSGNITSIIKAAQIDGSSPKKIHDEIFEIKRINPGLEKEIITKLGFTSFH